MEPENNQANQQNSTDQIQPTVSTPGPAPTAMPQETGPAPSTEPMAMPQESMPPALQSSGGNKKKILLLVVLALVILLAAGAVAMVMMNKDDKESAAPKQASTVANDDTTTNTDTEPAKEEETTEAETDVASGQVAATIDNFAFTPKTLKVKKGSTVTWTNNDSAAHTVSSDSDSPQLGLDSGLIAQGKTYSFTFDTVGTFAYHCKPHPSMKATVEVTE